MLKILLLLFIVVPLVELTLLLKLADATTWEFTLGLVILTGVLGTLLARTQGWRTWQQIQQQLAAGQLPGDSILDAMLILVAGALLLTPGMLTDAFGLTLLVPFTRRLYRNWLKRRFRGSIQIRPTTRWEDSSGESEIIDSYVVDRTERADEDNRAKRSSAEGTAPRAPGTEDTTAKRISPKGDDDDE